MARPATTVPVTAERKLYLVGALALLAAGAGALIVFWSDVRFVRDELRAAGVL